jgi:hypothetical protein
MPSVRAPAGGRTSTRGWRSGSGAPGTYQLRIGALPPRHFVYTTPREQLYQPYRVVWSRALAARRQEQRCLMLPPRCRRRLHGAQRRGRHRARRRGLGARAGDPARRRSAGNRLDRAGPQRFARADRRQGRRSRPGDRDARSRCAQARPGGALRAAGRGARAARRPTGQRVRRAPVQPHHGLGRRSSCSEDGETYMGIQKFETIVQPA